MATEVWLYGSTARGNYDASSDVDLLVVGEDDVSLVELELPPGRNVSVSRYSWEEIAHMASYGSLFLHHVRLEGRPLSQEPEQKLRQLLDALGPYRRAAQELESFQQVVDDVEEALRGDHSPSYELAVLGTSVRHAAILGCYLLGEPEFGRQAPFRRLLPKLGYDARAVADLEHLYAYRVAENLGVLLDPLPSSKDVSRWLPKVRELLDKVEDLIHEHA